MHSISHHHPPADALAASAGGADSVVANCARAHTHECPVCRAELLDYQRIIDVLREYNSTHVADDGEHLTVEELQSYVALPVDDPAKVGFHRHIHACGHCTKVALTLAARMATTNNVAASNPNDPGAPPVRLKSGVWMAVLSCVRGHLAVLMGGAVFLIASTATVTWVATRGPALDLIGTTIMAYQDDEMMYFASTAGAELGGFSTSARRATPFAGIQINETEDRRYQVNWEPVPGAVEYELRVVSFSGGEPRVEFSQVVLVPRVMIPGRQLRTGGRFEWELHGKTFDDLVFTARGGFVIQSLAGQE